ncbi:MAG: hypothetical protein V5789_04190 [Colwellia sp.]
MEPIRYLPKSDLAVPSYLESAKSLLTQLSKGELSPSINDIVSISNILRYIEDGLGEYLGNPDPRELKKTIIEFCQSNGSIGVLDQFSQLDGWLDADFWQFYGCFGLEKKLEEAEFASFLSQEEPSIRPILFQTKLRKRFKSSIRDYFLSNAENVRYLLERKEIGISPSPPIPKDITPEDELSLVTAYIYSESPGHRALEILARSKSVPPKLQLAAIKRAKEIGEQVFKSSASALNVGVEITYKEQKDIVEHDIEDGILKCSYDINWIRENSDKATLLLYNFIHLFNYTDDHGRITLCFQMSEIGVFQRTMLNQRTDWYPNESLAFMQKNQAACLQLHSYSRVLGDVEITSEELINWFFNEYIKVEFEIEGFQSNVPEGDRPFIEKCRLLAPEIERVLKLFQLLVDDGHIDHDLIAINTNPFAVATTGSFFNSKYCYLESEDGKIATHYFYSDQCMLNYDSHNNNSYPNFATRLAKQPLCTDDFEEYQKRDLDWLEQKGFLNFDSEGSIKITSMPKILFLGEIFRNGCLVYNSYEGEWRQALDQMIEEGTMCVESSLFSEPEGKYIDYHLNKRQFINSLDLRNKYVHGSHAGSDEGEHELNYIQMLKIMVCIVLKINDELCHKY